MTQLQIFIFVMSVTHVTFSVSTMLLGAAKIRQWKQWEAELHKNTARNGARMISYVQENSSKKHFKGFGQNSRILRWLHSFVKLFYGSVTKIDYTTVRRSFINTHCNKNQKFDFHKYMMRILQNDLKKLVGISWYMWIFVVFYLLLNVNGWQAYFWISFLPLLLLFAVGTKQQHIISLARDVVDPSDCLFWFGRPRIIIDLIHFILFQNAFAIAFVIWILVTYGFNSCIMGKAGLTVPRLIIGLIIQLLCSYNILPLYVIVTQMGSSYQKEIFHENVHRVLKRWAQKNKMKRRDNHGTAERSNTSGDSAGPSTEMASRTALIVATEKPVGQVMPWPGVRIGAVLTRAGDEGISEITE